MRRKHLIAALLLAAAGCTLALQGQEPDSPPDPPVDVSDLWRFPDRDTAWASWRFACRHRDWLDARRRLAFSDEREHLGRWAADARWCLACWDALADAWGGPAVEEYGRLPHDAGAAARHLGRLRGLVGEEAYRRGSLPAPVPYWFFGER